MFQIQSGKLWPSNSAKSACPRAADHQSRLIRLREEKKRRQREMANPDEVNLAPHLGGARLGFKPMRT